MTAIISCVICSIIVCSQAWHGKHTLDHDLSGVQKYHVIPVPRIGGVAIFSSVLLTIFLAGEFPFVLLPTEHMALMKLLLIASLPAFFSGLLEDLTKRISAKFRFIAAFVSALMASWLVGATVDSLDLWGVDQLLIFSPIALLITAFVVTGGVNAINIIDGFNGLAASVVVVMLSGFAILAWEVNDKLILTLAILGCGATIGFLIVNFPFGRIFLGDGGAYFLGFWVAEVAVLLLIRNSKINAWQVLSICAYPVIEVLFSIYRRRIVRKAPPGAPDGMHLHTLVYRRYVFKFVCKSDGVLWRRNAMVTCLIVPCVACIVWVTLVIGNTIVGAMALVLFQLVFYLLTYRRLVLGRWRRPSVEVDLSGLAVKRKAGS